jgi:F0F1-type ATP synthase membrane subunit b/b'
MSELSIWTVVEVSEHGEVGSHWVSYAHAHALLSRVKELANHVASAEALLAQRAQDIEQYKDRVQEMEETIQQMLQLTRDTLQRIEGRP